MSINKLRTMIRDSCCGIVLDKPAALELINEIEATLETREQLLVETLYILESSNKAIRMDIVNSSVIENHSAAIQAIQNHFESKLTEGPENDSLQKADTNLHNTTQKTLAVVKRAKCLTCHGTGIAPFGLFGITCKECQ